MKDGADRDYARGDYDVMGDDDADAGGPERSGAIGTRLDRTRHGPCTRRRRRTTCTRRSRTLERLKTST